VCVPSAALLLAGVLSEGLAQRGGVVGGAQRGGGGGSSKAVGDQCVGLLRWLVCMCRKATAPPLADVATVAAVSTSKSAAGGIGELIVGPRQVLRYAFTVGLFCLYNRSLCLHNRSLLTPLHTSGKPYTSLVLH
jgi:hypothetical protein